MARPQSPYVSAPIIEAVVEIRFDEAFDEQQIKKVATKLGSYLPEIDEVDHVNIELKLPEEKIERSKEQRFRLSNSDQTLTCIIAKDRIIISQFAPYSDYSFFENHIKKCWEIAYKHQGFRPISRIGMRYINRIDLAWDESGSIDYEDFFNLRINLPEEFHTLTGYKIEFTFPIKEAGLKSRIISTVAEGQIIGHASFFLDIDVYGDTDVPQKKSELLSYLQRCRAQKNDLFETFITDKARGLFNA